MLQTLQMLRVLQPLQAMLVFPALLVMLAMSAMRRNFRKLMCITRLCSLRGSGLRPILPCGRRQRL